jgi:hypothetical protein
MALQVTASARAMKLTGRSSYCCSRRRISCGLRPARFKLIKRRALDARCSAGRSCHEFDAGDCLNPKAGPPLGHRASEALESEGGAFTRPPAGQNLFGMKSRADKKTVGPVDNSVDSGELRCSSFGTGQPSAFSAVLTKTGRSRENRYGQGRALLYRLANFQMG